MNSASNKCLHVLICISFFVFVGHAQRNANWYFGNKAALKFTPTGPTPVSGSEINTSEGCATMSDDNGNLLFYTDGVTVWDKNNNIMFNGTGLRGGSSSSQSSIVVPAPGSLKKYYIFTSVQVEADPSNKREYCYNLVDMGLRGGLGEVVQKNVVFDTACSERLTAANHANGSDFWIITNSVRSNTFKVFAITASGLSPNPIIQNIGETVLGGIGMCKVSPNGKWLIQTYTKTNLSSAQLFSFNAATGQITNPISLNTAFNCTYGCAFSPNSNRLYLSTGFNCTGNPANTIIQFTLSNSLPAILLNSLTPIIVNTNALGSGDLSIGLDEKLYIARVGQRLSRFENPNDTGTSLIFTDTAILFSNPSRVLLGLPNYYNNINLPPSTIKIIEQSCLTYKFSFPASANFPFGGIYSWNFGDGSALNNDSTPTHSFTRGLVDSFLVSLNFSSPDNTISINQEIWIKLPPKPSAQFTFQTNGCANDSVRFTNTSTSNNGAITKSFWSFGDGTFSNSFQPKKNYNDTGTFAIKLVVTDTLGCTSDTLTKPITINKKVKANFTILSPLCKGVSIAIIDSSVAINTTINNWSYRWNNNFGYNANNNGNFNFIPTTQELYTFKLVVNTVEGCVSDTITKSYLVNNNPAANFILPKSCVLDRSDFINTSSTPTGSVINFYKWDFGVNDRLSDTSRLANGSYQYDVANAYPVSLLVINDKGCRDSLTQNFIVNGAVPKAAFRFTTNPICGGDSIVLVNESKVDFGNLTRVEIVWDNFNVVDTNPTIISIYKYQFASFGTPSSITKPIKLKVFSGLSCTSNIDSFITINAQPKVAFSLPQDSLCGNDFPISLNQGVELNGALGAFSYTGNGVINLGANQFQFNPRLVVPNTIAAIQYKYTTSSNCYDTATQQIVILPYPTVNAGLDRVVVQGEQTNLLATANGNNLQFSWTPSIYLNNPTDLQPIVNAQITTYYLLKATTKEGCTDTSGVNVFVLPPINPPNSFSPNSDAINDTWIIPNISLYNNCEVSIFNRQGQLLFRSVGYNTPWNGTYKQQPLPVATYYYIINLRNGKAPLTGWLQLLR